MKTAWLITWEETGDHAEKSNHKIVSILNWRLSGETVRKQVEHLYVDSEYSLTERLAYARSTKNHPYPAQFERLDGMIWDGRITCGQSPFLYARLVGNLRVERDAKGHEKMAWDEIPPPKRPKG